MKVFGIVAAALVVVGISASSLPASAQSDAIEQRKALMKSNGAAGRTIGAFLKDGKGTAADVATAARTIASNAERLPGLFPPGSDKGETRALPVIWEKKSDFDAMAATLRTKAMALASAAEAGDKDKIAAANADMGRNACGACHSTYRASRN